MPAASPRSPDRRGPGPSTPALTTTDPHFAPATAALGAALGARSAPVGPGFADLFTADAVLEVPFDGAGDGAPVRGRPALAGMVASLAGVLEFRQVLVHRVLDVDATTVVCEYEALLARHDLGRRLRRRYISVLTLRDGLIHRMREYGGPLMPGHVEQLEPCGCGPARR